MTFIGELKRRNVFKVGAAYVVVAWILAQITDVFLENFGSPDWVIKTVLLLLLIGFPLALFFAWAFEMTPEGLKKEKEVDRSQSITNQTGRKLDYTIIALMALALGYFAIDKFILTPALNSENVETVAETPEPATTETNNKKSIAVLPFVNMSDDAANEYFSDGISEEILNSLAKVKDLKVAGRTSSFAFKGQNQDLRQIGETLGVEHILEGSVRKAGTKVRITAQLIQVDDGFHLWSESYDRELNDIFAIQDEIATAILEQLKAHLIGVELPVLNTARTDSQAYEFYLLAKQRIYDRDRITLEAAVNLLDKAIAIDPDYAPAYAQRGIVALLLSDESYGTIPRELAQSQAKTHLDHALRLDPELAEAWAGLGLYYNNRPPERKRGIEVLEKALAINPNLIDAANWLQDAYTRANQPAKALKLLEQIIQRDPLYKPGFGNLVSTYIMMGRLDDALALRDKTQPFMVGDSMLPLVDAMISLDQGDASDGLRYAETALQMNPNDRVFRIYYSIGLGNTQQYEKLATEGYRGWRISGLRNLGRTEEASILAYQFASEGSLGGLFAFLNAADRSGELVSYLEERWPNLHAFEGDFPSNGYGGYRKMVDIALAYRRAGQQEKFAEAMTRFRKAHDSLISQGVKNSYFWIIEAAYYALANEQEKALELLAAAIDGGVVTSSRISDDMPYFKDMEGIAEYEAIQSRMIEHLNKERALLGLEPRST
jgi:TolB-like protein